MTTENRTNYPAATGVYRSTLPWVGWLLIKMVLDKPEILNEHSYTKMAIDSVLGGLRHASKYDPKAGEELAHLEEMYK